MLGFRLEVGRLFILFQLRPLLLRMQVVIGMMGAGVRNSYCLFGEMLYQELQLLVE